MKFINTEVQKVYSQAITILCMIVGGMVGAWTVEAFSNRAILLGGLASATVLYVVSLVRIGKLVSQEMLRRKSMEK